MLSCVVCVSVQSLGCVLFAVVHLIHPFQDAGNLGILNRRYSTLLTLSIQHHLNHSNTRWGWMETDVTVS
jgi:hypothetical protein